MASVKKGTLTRSPQWWKHLKEWKRVFWKSERQAQKREINGGETLRWSNWLLTSKTRIVPEHPYQRLIRCDLSVAVAPQIVILLVRVQPP